MDSKSDKTQTAARLALCGGIAAALYSVACKLPQLEPWKPWLEKNKVQAIALAAAVLFWLSLVLLPLDAEDEDHGQAPEGHERTEDLS